MPAAAKISAEGSPSPCHQPASDGEWLGLVWRAGMVVALGLATGFVVNSVRADGVPLHPYSPPTMCTGLPLVADAEPTVLHPIDLAPLCSATSVTVIDTRSAIAFAQGHVAGALHLPCTAPRGAAEAALGLIGTSTTVIFYGESTSEALEVASELMAKSGRANIDTYVVDGGFQAWKDANQPCASGPCDQCDSEFFHESAH